MRSTKLVQDKDGIFRGVFAGHVSKKQKTKKQLKRKREV